MNYEYFTLQIHFGNSQSPDIVEFKDLTPETKDFKMWTRELRAGLYQSGFNYQSGPGAWEFISPFLIHKILLIKQAGKYGN